MSRLVLRRIRSQETFTSPSPWRHVDVHRCRPYCCDLENALLERLCQRVVVRVRPLGVFVDVGLARRVGCDHAGEQGCRLSPKSRGVSEIRRTVEWEWKTHFMKCLCFALVSFAVTGDIKLSVGDTILWEQGHIC